MTVQQVVHATEKIKKSDNFQIRQNDKKNIRRDKIIFHHLSNLYGMIHPQHHLQLKTLLREKAFPIGVELVSTRGALSERRVRKVASFGEDLAHHPKVDWVSITDNAGGHPQLAPIALGTPILYRGKEVIVHLTCKDLNRNAIESQLWFMASHGFHNVLALTGDYPSVGDQGRAKPVFDLDSVSLLAKIKGMNEGLPNPSVKIKDRRIDATTFYSGAVVSPYKTSESHLWPQMLKMEQKLKQGAQYLVSQIGYDVRRARELLLYLQSLETQAIPTIANVYILSPMVIRLFSRDKIPGVHLPPKLLASYEKLSTGPDRGKAAYLELAAQQMAVLKGLGYTAGYIGGVSNSDNLDTIFNHLDSYKNDEWKNFVERFDAGDDGDYLFETSPLDSRERPSLKPLKPTKVSVPARLAKTIHHTCFDHRHPITRSIAKSCQALEDVKHWKKLVHGIEHFGKKLAFGCKDCGDCSLSETAFLCPESACAKNMRNGPCGGARGNRCEVLESDCIWARAYERRKDEGSPRELLKHSPVVQNHSLRGSSGWINYWLKLDHLGSDHSSRSHKETSTNDSNTKHLPKGTQHVQ